MESVIQFNLTIMKKTIVIIIAILSSLVGYTQNYSVKSFQKINNITGGLDSNTTQAAGKFGHAVAVIGDVDHDGIDDIAVGSYLDNDNDVNLYKGAVFILLLNADGTVKAQQRISGNDGGPDDFSASHRYFGSSIAPLGDLNGDGNVDIAVGMYGGGDDNTSGNYGAVYILFLDNDGSMLEYQKISNNEGGGPGTLDANDYFGARISCVGDINGDGIPDLAVKATLDDDGGTNNGACYLVYLDYNGMAKDIKKISETQGNFGGNLDGGDSFGVATAIGDVDSDGITDIAIGAPSDDDGGTNKGAVYICFMNADGTVKSEQKISSTQGNFTGILDDNDHFGVEAIGIDDLDGDGIHELAVASFKDDDGVTDGGAIWILYLNSDGTVRTHDKLACDDSLLVNEVEHHDEFMPSFAYFGDRDNDGKIDFLIGARNGYEAGNGGHIGEVYVTHLEGPITYPNVVRHSTSTYITGMTKIDDYTSPLSSDLYYTDKYGSASAGIGDLNGDGINDIVVGAFSSNEAGGRKGAVYVQFMNVGDSIDSLQKITYNVGGFTSTLDNSDHFGISVCNIGDLNGDGITDIGVGARFDDDGGADRGAVYVLFLDTNGTVKSEQKISDTQGNFTGTLNNTDLFGNAIAGPGDIDGDGIEDLVVGAYADDDGGIDRGALWILFLDTNGTVKSHQKISDTQGNFTETLDNSDQFGFSVTSIGDLNDDGNDDLAVGARLDDDTASNAGAVYILFLNDTGVVDSSQKITTGAGGFFGRIYANDYFGASVAGGYDLNNDGIEDLIVGADNKQDGNKYRKGTASILFLNADGTVKDYKPIGPTAPFMGGQLDNKDWYGRSASVYDYDAQNNTAKIAIGAIEDDAVDGNEGAVYLFNINTYLALQLSYKTTPENEEGLGSIILYPKDGAQSYHYFWADGDQSAAREGLASDVYTVTVVDTLADSLTVTIPVGVTLAWDSIDSLTVDYDILAKTGSNGWNNGRATLTNVVDGNGEIRVEVGDLSKQWTFGYRSASSARAQQYSDMDFSLYVDAANKLYSYENATQTYLTTVTKGDIVSIELNGDQVHFKKNESTLRQVSFDPSSTNFKIDFSLYSAGMSLGKATAISFPYWVKPVAVITPVQCYGNSGAINLTVNGAEPTAYSWVGPNGFTASTQDISGIAAGTYTVNISYGSSFYVTRTYEVGYEVVWKNIAGASANGDDLTDNHVNGNTYGNSGASSVNMLEKGEDGWIEFSVTMNSPQNALVVGLNDLDNDQNYTSIDYGLKFSTLYLPPPFNVYLKMVHVVEGGVQQTGVTYFEDGYKFKMKYNATTNQISYHRNGAVIFWLAGPNFYSGYVSSNVPQKRYMVDAALADKDEGIDYAVTSFGCPVPGYPVLKKKLDAGFFTTVKQRLWFQFMEEYTPVSSPALNYAIYDSGMSAIGSLSSETVTKIGANYYEMDVSSLSPVLVAGDYYVLEVTNEKNEKFLMRFLYQ